MTGFARRVHPRDPLSSLGKVCVRILHKEMADESTIEESRDLTGSTRRIV